MRCLALGTHISIMRLGFLIVGACCLQFSTARRDSGDASSETRVLEERFDAVTRRLELLETRDETHRAEIDCLKAELREQKERTATLEKLVERLQAKKEDVEEVSGEDMDAGAVTNDKKVNVNAKQSQRLSSGSKSVVRQSRKMTDKTERQAQNENPVAFFATLDKHVVHAGPNQVVLFDHVITNLGNAYVPSLGAFIAPVPGIYVFSVTLTAYGVESEHYILSKNNQVVSLMYSKADSSPYMVSGQTAVLQLNKGDNIEIRTRDQGGSVHALYSSFAGFLLQQDYSGAAVVGK